jgi:hypothetical protein
MKSYAEIAYESVTPNGDTPWAELPIEERGICELVAQAVIDEYANRQTASENRSDDHALLQAAVALRAATFYVDGYGIGSFLINEARAVNDARLMLAAIRTPKGQ